MTITSSNQNLQVLSPCLDEPPPPPPPVPPPPPPPKQKPLNCVQCSVLLKDSPARRSGPQGPGTLCNACGLRILKRKRAARGAIKKSPRRPRQTRTPRKRQSQSQNNNDNNNNNNNNNSNNNNPTQSPLYPTAVPITQSSSAESPVQPRLFPAVSHPQTHVSPSPGSTLSPPTSASTSAVPSPAVSCAARPTPPINPASVHIIRQNAVPAPAVNPTHSSAQCSRPLHARSPTPPRQTHATPDPLQLQLAEGPPRKNPHVMQPQQHHHPMPSLPHQYADAESPAAEHMFNALQIEEMHPRGETPTQESDTKIDQVSFPPNVFGRCDSAGTASTQLDLVEVLEGMEKSHEQMPPGNDIIPVEGPYDDHGAVDSIAMAMGSMPMPTAPVSMAPAHFSGIMPVQSSPMPTIVMQPGDITSCMESLATLGQMNSHITHSVSSMDHRIATLARKHEELTQARNDVIISITQLESEKNVAAKKQRQVCDDIARTTCLLHFLQKQESFPQKQESFPTGA